MTVVSLKPNYLKRYKDIVSLLIRHGQAEWFQVSGLDQAFLDDEMRSEEPTEDDPAQLARDLEALGPTFIKLGQLLSTRPDLLPQPYLDALSRLQDEVEPFPYEAVQEIILEELGMRISQAFRSFEPEPIAAASLGQVHRAKLCNGRVVAVKVQRPGIRQMILEDLEAFNEIATLIDQHTDIGRRYAFEDMLDEFRKALLRELDYRREAQNLVRLAENLDRYPNIVVPLPIEDYTTSKVLTMEYVAGTKITDLGPLALLEIDG